MKYANQLLIRHFIKYENFIVNTVGICWVMWFPCCRLHNINFQMKKFKQSVHDVISEGEMLADDPPSVHAMATSPISPEDPPSVHANNDQTMASDMQPSTLVKPCSVSVCDIGSQVKNNGSLGISQTCTCPNISQKGAGLRRSLRLKMKPKKRETCKSSSLNVPYDMKHVLNTIYQITEWPLTPVPRTQICSVRGMLELEKVSNGLQFI